MTNLNSEGVCDGVQKLKKSQCWKFGDLQEKQQEGRLQE